MVFEMLTGGQATIESKGMLHPPAPGSEACFSGESGVLIRSCIHHTENQSFINMKNSKKTNLYILYRLCGSMLSKEGSSPVVCTCLVKKWQCRIWEATKVSLKKIPNEGYITEATEAPFRSKHVSLERVSMEAYKWKLGQQSYWLGPSPLFVLFNGKSAQTYIYISEFPSSPCFKRGGCGRTCCTLPPPPIGSNHRLLKRWSCIDIFPPSVEVPAWRWHQGIFKQTLQHWSRWEICRGDVISCHEWTNHQLVQVFQHRAKIATLKKGFLVASSWACKKITIPWPMVLNWMNPWIEKNNWML